MEYKETAKEKREEKKLELGYTLKSAAKVIRQFCSPSVAWRAYKIHKIKTAKEK